MAKNKEPKKEPITCVFKTPDNKYFKVATIGGEYVVNINKGGAMFCNCIAGTYNRPCKHKDFVKEIFLCQK